jgi:hypothetical protein
MIQREDSPAPMKLYRAICSPSVMLSRRKEYFDFEAIFRYAETGVSKSAGSDEHIGMQLAFFCFRSVATSSNDGDGCGETTCQDLQQAKWTDVQDLPEGNT